MKKYYLLLLDLLVAPLLGSVVIDQVSQLSLELGVLVAELVEVGHVIDHMHSLHLISEQLLILLLHDLCQQPCSQCHMP